MCVLQVELDGLVRLATHFTDVPCHYALLFSSFRATILLAAVVDACIRETAGGPVRDAPIS